MSGTEILIPAAIVGGCGLLIGLLLGVLGKILAVQVDEKEAAVLAALPGNNCGGCGFAGCAALAEAIAKGEAPVSACPVGGAACAEKISEIMGVDAGEMVRKTAFVKCSGDCNKTKYLYEYTGIKDCRIAYTVQNGGQRGCMYGCLGFGNCVKVCDFDALHVNNGIVVVDKENCKACGKCIAECPKKLIEMVPYAQKHLVGCSSKEKGKDVMAVCSVGCIGCKMCQKVCEAGAITVENNLAHIDPEKCTNCGKCAEKCPKKIII